MQRDGAEWGQAAGRRVAIVDYLRVAAIGFVLLHHTQLLRFVPLLARLDDILTWMALAVLFALSGFLAARGKDRSGWTHIKRRFARLYLPFAIALILFKVLGLSPLTWSDVPVHLALLGPWIGPPVLTLWFVEILLFYQIVYGVWLALPQLRTHGWTLPVLMGLITCVLGALALHASPQLDARLVVYLPAFAGGACLAVVQVGGDGRAGQRWRFAGCFAAAVGVAALVSAALLWGHIPLWGDQSVAAAVVAALTTLGVAGLLARPPRSGTRREPPLLIRQVAYGSYMAYLSHSMVFAFVAKAFYRLGGTWLPPALLLSIPLVLLVGIFLQSAFDRMMVRADR